MQVLRTNEIHGTPTAMDRFLFFFLLFLASLLTAGHKLSSGSSSIGCARTQGEKPLPEELAPTHQLVEFSLAPVPLPRSSLFLLPAGFLT